MGGFLIGIGGFMLLLELCIIVFVWKAARNMRLKVAAILVAVLIPCYAAIEGYSSLTRTNQALNIPLLRLGWILFYTLLAAAMVSVVWFVRSTAVKRGGTKPCRKCGLENVIGAWVCGDCRSFLPEYSVATLAVVLVLLSVGFAVIGQIVSVFFDT
jgi:hypothetical protein